MSEYFCVNILSGVNLGAICRVFPFGPATGDRGGVTWPATSDYPIPALEITLKAEYSADESVDLKDH